MFYNKLFRTAYHITLHNPVLWLFGLFVIGGMSVNFIRLLNGLPKQLLQEVPLHTAWDFFAANPAWLAQASAVLLLVSVVGLLITNWSRIMLVLTVQQIQEQKHVDLAKLFPESKKALWPAIKVSLLTSVFMLVVAGALLVPPWLVGNANLQPTLTTVGLVIFVPLAFTISCINIFTTFFVILFKKGVWASLNLGTDFFITNWTSIVGVTFVLAVIYSAGFVAGASFVYLLKFIVSSVVDALPFLGPGTIAFTHTVVQVLAGLVLWVLLGLLNTFFNTVFLLLFFELITPLKTEQKKSAEILPVPAAL